MPALIIAIDGPSGAGKGTVARAVAARLGYRHVDSGAMYRAVGWKALEDAVPLDDEAAVARIAQQSRIEVVAGVVSIDDLDVTRAIRTPEIDRAAAVVARLPSVRSELVIRQRNIGQNGGIVMEGRDIGTVVFPSADVKIYLDASGTVQTRNQISTRQAKLAQLREYIARSLRRSFSAEARDRYPGAAPVDVRRSRTRPHRSPERR